MTCVSPPVSWLQSIRGLRSLAGVLEKAIPREFDPTNGTYLTYFVLNLDYGKSITKMGYALLTRSHSLTGNALVEKLTTADGVPAPNLEVAMSSTA